MSDFEELVSTWIVYIIPIVVIEMKKFKNRLVPKASELLIIKYINLYNRSFS